MSPVVYTSEFGNAMNLKMHGKHQTIECSTILLLPFYPTFFLAPLIISEQLVRFQTSHIN